VHKEKQVKGDVLDDYLVYFFYSILFWLYKKN
jgi:hypothetical protein